MTAPIAFTILGEMASKSNSRMLVPVPGTDRVRSIKSAKARNFAADAKLQCPKRADLPFTVPVRVEIHAYYATERSDLDETALLDALQSAYYNDKATGKRVLAFVGIWANDRLVRERHVYHHIDEANPRVEVRAEERG